MEMFVGSRNLEIIDELDDISFPVWVMYPTRSPSVHATVGPYSIDISPNATPAEEGHFPLVIISHGSGGSYLVYRTIGSYLAKHGYVVAMPEHSGNNVNNNELNGTVANLVNRPRHIRLTIDAIASDAQLRNLVQPDNTAIIGHSMGGYTALAIAGGTPWSELQKKVEVERDRRVKTLILLAPATAWYLPDDSLRDVVIPILMLVAEHDPFTPRWQADLVLDHVPDRTQVTFRVVDNAGHFSFISPFPPTMRSADFLPSTDPEGFDREKFHESLNAEILEFLDKILKGC